MVSVSRAGIVLEMGAKMKSLTTNKNPYMVVIFMLRKLMDREESHSFPIGLCGGATDTCSENAVAKTSYFKSSICTADDFGASTILWHGR